MADTKFVGFDVLKRIYETLRGIINSNQKNTEAVITDISTKADKALATSTAVANDAKNFATKDQLEQHKQLAASTYATKEELQSGIGGVVSFEFKIVDTLPTTGVSQIVYLMRNASSSGNNIYNEYLWIASSNKYERIGSMDLDLSGYLTRSDASSTYATKTDLSTGLAAKSDTGHTHSYAGSSSAGGVAISADKLTKSAGSSIQPVYFSNGVPVATGYTVSKSVPADAVFTDTTYQQANANTLGLIRLYTSKGQNTDGTMTQKAITDAINSGISSGTSDSAVNDSDGNPINTTYLKKTTAESTYLAKTDASSIYLTKTNASNTYLGKTATAAKATADASGNNISDTYLKKASADEVYLTKNSASSTYLTKTDASNTYLGKTATAAKATADASGNNISDTYLTKSSASSTYLGKTATAAAATKLATARTISLSGSVSGSASFDGTSNISINTTVQYGTEAPSTLSNGVLYCVVES